MKGDVSLGKKFVNLISSSICIFIKNFSEARDFLLYLAMIQEIPQQALQHLRSNPKSSGMEMEANLDFHGKHFYSQCSNISNRVSYFKLTTEEYFKIISD